MSENKLKNKRIGLALSGGGFRASIFHLGVLKFLAEEKILENVTYISTVSGGSLVMGLIYKLNNYKWPTSQIFLNDILPKIEIYFTKKGLLGYSIINLIIKPKNWLNLFSRANVVADTIKNNWDIKYSIKDLEDKPLWAINATTNESGKNFRYTKEKMGDYLIGYVKKPNFELSNAIATSASFPGLIGRFVLDTSKYEWSEYSGKQIKPKFNKIHLSDGGVYDNLGTEVMIKKSFNNDNELKLRNEIDFLIISDASAPLKVQNSPFVFRVITRTIRLIDIATDQVRSLRLRLFFELFTKNSNGIIVKMGTNSKTIIKYAKNHLSEEIKNLEYLDNKHCEKANNFKTNLKSVSKEDYNDLLEHGYAVAKATYSAYV